MRSLFPQVLDQEPHGALQERQLVGGPHRPGDVQQEHQVAGRALGGIDGLGLDPDAEQKMFLLPGRPGHFHAGGDGVLSAGRVVGIGEIIDHLLDADGIPRRQRTLAEKTADVGVGRGIHVDAEGGKRDPGPPFETGSPPGTGSPRCWTGWGRAPACPAARQGWRAPLPMEKRGTTDCGIRDLRRRADIAPE